MLLAYLPIQQEKPDVSTEIILCSQVFGEVFGPGILDWNPVEIDILDFLHSNMGWMSARSDDGSRALRKVSQGLEFTIYLIKDKVETLWTLAIVLKGEKDNRKLRAYNILLMDVLNVYIDNPYMEEGFFKNPQIIPLDALLSYTSWRLGKGGL